MSQIFHLQLAPDSLSKNAQQLGICAQQLQKIWVQVEVSLFLHPAPQLVLHYHIQLPNSYLAEKLDWPLWQQKTVWFTDYLWERTCLECFISSHGLSDKDNINKSPYIEINACPNGQYALYQFEDYRTPSTLPPVPLLNNKKAAQSLIHWYPHPAPSTASPPYYYQRLFSLALEGLPFWQTNAGKAIYSDADTTHNTDILIELIHPCVILKLDQISLYFAPAHSSPPDFHQRRYWSRFDPKKALKDNKI